VAFSKIDLVSERADLTPFSDALRKRGIEVFPISGATGEGIGELLARAARVLDEVDAEAAA
jgi:GTP-binding protein